MYPSNDSNKRNDRKDVPNFEGQKWVDRLIHVPEVIWSTHLKKIFDIYGIWVPRQDYDIYKAVDLEPYIAKAGNPFRTALIGYALAFVGIKLSFVEQEGKAPVPTIEIDPAREEYARETIKALMRRDKQMNYIKSVVDPSNPTTLSDAEYLKRLESGDIKGIRDIGQTLKDE